MLELMPIDFKTACDFVGRLHRHHKAPVGHKFSIGVAADRALVGVVMCGRPVARHLDDGRTVEVNRLCTDGTKNACSMLYGAAWRAARALGYTRIVTYTLPEEGGASLRAAGWGYDGESSGRSWDHAARPRPNEQADLVGAKCRWVKSV